MSCISKALASAQADVFRALGHVEEIDACALDEVARRPLQMIQADLRSVLRRLRNIQTITTTARGQSSTGEPGHLRGRESVPGGRPPQLEIL